MNIEDIALKLQETTDRSTRNEGRIKKLESEHKALTDLATSVAVMAEQIKTMNTSVQTLTTKVDTLEEKPGKRWDSLVEKIILGVAAALLGFVLAQIGL
jgi:predicted nuclease with TOPRIM domain